MRILRQEGVVGFGKTSADRRDGEVLERNAGLIYVETITETLSAGLVEEQSGQSNTAEVGGVEGGKIGAPDTN